MIHLQLWKDGVFKFVYLKVFLKKNNYKNCICLLFIQDTLDFLAYIAKNEDEWRACYVLECIGGQSEDVIVTIGKAFMLRYNAISRKG